MKEKRKNKKQNKEQKTKNKNKNIHRTGQGGDRSYSESVRAK